MQTMTDDKTKHWYIIHTYSGFENKVKESLLQRVQAYGLQHEIGEVLIPTEDIVEKRGGREVYATTLVVILTSAFFGLYLWGIDLALSAAVAWLYRAFGAR